MDLLERAPFLHELDVHLQQAASGRGTLLFVGGEAGVGKTVLVRSFLASLPAGIRLASGACDPLTTPRPLGPLLDAAEALGLADAGEPEAPRRLLFGRLLANLGTRTTLLVFEDVHWGDEATLDLLLYLGRRIAATRTLLLATYRDDEVGALHPLRAVLGNLGTASGVRRMALPPLSEDAVRQLAQGIETDAAALYRRTGGNPFYVTEILANPTLEIPATVQDAVLARAARLPNSGRAVLGAAAVIGARVDVRLLATVVGSEIDAAERCVDGGLLIAQGASFVFRHELARQAVLDALPPHRRQTLHGLVLDALRASPTAVDPARLAHHAEEAREPAAVLAYAPEAARQAAAVSAHREAEAQYARALRFASSLPLEEQARLLEGHAWESHLTGAMEKSVRSREAAIDLWRRVGDPHREGENLARLAHTLVLAGRNADGERASRAAIEVLEALPPSPQRALAYRFQGYLRMLDRDPAEAVRWGTEAIALAERFHDVDTLAHSYNCIGSALLIAGDVDRGREALERSLQLALEAGLEIHVGNAYGNLGSGAGEIFQFALADSYLALAVAHAAEHDLDADFAYSSAWQALSHLYQGRWNEAADTARAVLRRPTLASISRIMALVGLGRLRARRGDPGAWAALDEAVELAERTQTLQRIGPVRAARAEAAWLDGKRDKTRDEARAAFGLALDKRHPWFLGELAYWRWKAGDLPEAPPGVAEPFGLQMAGRWREAAAAWLELGCPYEAARALSEGDDAAALRDAHARFERLGALPMLERVRRTLHHAGAPGVPRGPRAATRAHPAGLTRKESEVLALLTKGLRNADIASRLHSSEKTVGHHVSAILAKLGVRNRTGAATKAAELGLTQVGEPDEPT